MRSVLRRHPFVVLAAALVLLVVVGVAAAPWWIDLGPVRAKIERAASSALAGKLTYERMDLSWYPRTEAVLRSGTVSVPGTVHGTVRTVRVAFAFLPLLRGRLVPSRIAVDGLDAFVSRPDGRGLWVEGLKAEGSFRSFEGRTEIVLSRLSVDSPALTASGDFRWDPVAPRAHVSVSGSLDGDAVRSQLLALAGDDRTISQICAIFRGGRLTSFSLDSAAPSPSDLFVLERMKIRAKVEGASLRIEGPGLHIVDVSADVALEGGMLLAERAAARVGRSSAKDGRVLVGLLPGDGRLRISARVKADLAELPALLARAVPSRTFREELALVEGLAGTAAGRIEFGDCADDLGTAISVSELRFSASYRRLPWPLRVDGGEFTFDGKRVGVNRLSGSVGLSTFSGLAARVRLGKRPALESSTGSLVVSLEDFFEGVRTRPGAEALASNVRRVSGAVFVDVQRLAGPLARLGEASVAASGTFKEILFDSSSLPALSIPSGRFAVGNDAIRMTDADVRTLDASLRISSAWSGWRGGREAFEAAAEGELGPDAIDWGWKKASLPAEFRPAAPIALHGVRFSRALGGALTATADFVVANGPRLTLDLAGEGKKIDVRNLTVADGDSTASMSLIRQDEAFDVAYEGRLAGPTLAKLFRGREWHGGAIEGDLRALIPAENLARLTAEGTLTATNFDVPTPAGPVTLDRIDVRATQNRFDVASSSLVLDGQRFSVAGSVTLREGGVSLDLASLAWGTFVWKPVLADVRFGKEVLVTIGKAEICGVSTTGEARFLPGGAMAVEARVDAAGPDINAPLTCLGFENARMTGSFEAGVQVKGEAPASELPRALRGPLSFKAVKGRIGKATLMTRILGVLNATEVFAGKDKTRVGDASPYERLTVSGEVANGRFSIGEAAFVAPSLTMAATGTVGYLDQSLDLMVLSHPLSTLDKIVQAVPLVRRILGRNFLAVAVKVTGTTGDPKVAVTPARDVGKGLVGILERTVTLPVTVFDPPAKGVGSPRTSKEDE